MKPTIDLDEADRHPALAGRLPEITPGAAELFNPYHDPANGQFDTADGGGQTIGYGGTHGAAAAQALGSRIAINKEQYQSMSDAGRRNLIAHELAHNIVEDKILHDMDEWDKAVDALTVKETGDGRKMFIMGQMRIGEAMVTTISTYVNDEENPLANFEPTWLRPTAEWTPEQWTAAMDWADHALQYAGMSKQEFNALAAQLKTQLETEADLTLPRGWRRWIRQLFNPYHAPEDGRFTTADQAGTINGKRVLHGTVSAVARDILQNGIESFDPGQYERGQDWGPAIYMTTNPESAEYWAEYKAGDTFTPEEERSGKAHLIIFEITADPAWNLIHDDGSKSPEDYLLPGGKITPDRLRIYQTYTYTSNGRGGYFWKADEQPVVDFVAGDRKYYTPVFVLEERP